MYRCFRVGAPALLLALSAGCFNYRPASLTELKPGETVRVYLTREQAGELDELIGLTGRQLVGNVVESGNARLLLDVPAAVVNDPTTGARTLKQRVALPLAGVMELEQRKLSGWRTALAVVGITAAMGGLVALQLDGDNSPSEPKDGPEASRIPALRIHIPLPSGR